MCIYSNREVRKSSFCKCTIGYLNLMAGPTLFNLNSSNLFELHCILVSLIIFFLYFLTVIPSLLTLSLLLYYTFSTHTFTHSFLHTCFHPSYFLTFSLHSLFTLYFIHLFFLFTSYFLFSFYFHFNLSFLSHSTFSL